MSILRQERRNKMVKTADTNQTTLLSKVVKYCDKIGASISSEKWDVVLGDSFLEEAISGPMRENTSGGSVDAKISLIRLNLDKKIAYLENRKYDPKKFNYLEDIILTFDKYYYPYCKDYPDGFPVNYVGNKYLSNIVTRIFGTTGIEEQLERFYYHGKDDSYNIGTILRLLSKDNKMFNFNSTFEQEVLLGFIKENLRSFVRTNLTMYYQDACEMIYNHKTLSKVATKQEVEATTIDFLNEEFRVAVADDNSKQISFVYRKVFSLLMSQESLSLSPEAVNDLQKIIGLYKNEKVDIFGWDKLVHVFGDLEFYYFYLQLLKENSSNISLNIDLSSMFEITDFGEIAYLKNFSKLNTILDTIKDLSQSITITGLSKIVTNPFGALFCNSDSFKQFVEALSWDVVTIPEEDECGLQYLNLQSQIATIVSKEQKDKSDESGSDSEQNITTDFIPDEVDESFAPYQGIIF
jgi:hypothetical protein